MKTEKQLQQQVITEYLSGGVTYRELALKYGVPRQSVHNWVASYKGKKVTGRSTAQQGLLQEVNQLKAQLQDSRLENQLLKAMMKTAKEELGIDIRKKPGAKQS